MLIHYDNQIVIFIIGNSTFHEYTKYIEIDCHYIQDKIMSRLISTLHVTSSHQFADIFMKNLAGISYDVMYIKLDMLNLYATT
ncbi:unnamed protein product [Spirodela intermedia]|uniref:Uncharacterized protein n=1 Tax=Spirodela intermedia TaxID=51605 RepID=A0A7I8INZ0_SPIIN|nr:unnamed protein product [Spirodela intermedia]CAA6659490.1 unnamed protein product [Spirodela intermedia]